jgi:RIO-like serine/threonine protein kinase
LVHGNLNPYNLMVNEKIDIVALLDREWSRVVPPQFF